MSKNWLSLKNILLLVFGLGIIGYSAYRSVRDFDQSSSDTIGGEEIVVISENTPVGNLPDSSEKQVNLDAPVKTSSNGNSPEIVSDGQQLATEPQKEMGKTPESVPVQDTFLTQIDKPSRSEKSQEIIPDRIVIPTIQLNASVVTAGSQTVKVGDQTFDQWVAPNQFAAGWHGSSAYLGEKGNTVINGHHNEYGKVFGNLVNLKIGETIYVYSGKKIFPYIISNKMIVKEKNEDLQTRMDNSSWIQPSPDERLTLITCWPPETNTHRLIIVAVPFVTSPERVSG